MVSISPAKLRKEYVQKLRDIDYLLGSVEVIGFIQDQDQATRQKFFNCKTDISITRSRLEREFLGAITFQLEELAVDFKDGIKNLEDELGKLDNVNNVFNAIDVVIATLTRIFI
jgi:hypothetical protein